MMRKMGAALQLVIWLLPASRAKYRILRVFGHEIHHTALVRSNIVWRVGSITIGPSARVGRWNVFKNLRAVRIGESASMGRFNVFGSHPVYVRLYPDGGELEMATKSKITGWHRIDCSGSVRLGELASIAGNQTSILTHSVDLKKNAQAAYPVVIGPRSFVGARCLILGGATLPGCSVLAAGSVLTRSKKVRQPGLWAGSPAAYRGELTGDWFERTDTYTLDVYVPHTDQIVKHAFGV